MDQQREEEEDQDQEDTSMPLAPQKEEENDSLSRCKEHLHGPYVVHTTNLVQKTSVQLQDSSGNAAACSVLLSGLVTERGPLHKAWTFQNGGDATPPMPPPSTGIKRGRVRPRKDQQSSQPKPPPPPTPTASRRGIKVGCGRPMLARKPIIIEKLPAAWWSVYAASTAIKRPRGRPRKERRDDASAGIKRPSGRPRNERPDAASAGIKRPRGRPRKERPDAASAGIKRPRGRPRKERPEARMSAETGYAAASMAIKTEGVQPEPGMEMLAAAAMLAETGDVVPTSTKGGLENPRSVDVMSTGMEGPLENPTPRIEKPSADDIVSIVMKRGRGRPRKYQQSQAPTTPTASSTGGIKRGRGRPRKVQQSQTPTTPTAQSTGGIKRGPGRPRKDQQSEAKPPPTPTESSGGIKRGRGRPMIIEKPPAARYSVDAASTGIERLHGSPRKETPSVAMSVETGDATPAPETGDAMPAPETGDAMPAEGGDAASAGIKRPRGRPRKERPEDAASSRIKRPRGRPRKERPEDAASSGIKRPCGRPRKERPEDAASSGIKRGRGRPRKEKPEARMRAETGYAGAAASTGFRRGGGQVEPGMDMLAAVAATMLAETGDGAVATGGSKGAAENPRNPRMEKSSAADDVVWMVMKRLHRRPREEQVPGLETLFGDMAEASRRRKQGEEGWGKTTGVEEEKYVCVPVEAVVGSEANLGSVAENAKASGGHVGAGGATDWIK